MTNEEFEKFSASQFALKSYMDFKVSNAHIHKARVLCSVNRRSIHKILKVSPTIDTNISFIDIIGDDEFSRDLKPRYTNKDSVFQFLNGTLIIKSKDIWGNPIEIDISAI
ncbi:TPA: hypothetical protein KQE37_002657 [Clostridioides difficile]|nr:hypothetical protein [Clostridioides difficile]